MVHVALMHEDFQSLHECMCTCLQSVRAIHDIVLVHHVLHDCYSTRIPNTVTVTMHAQGKTNGGGGGGY